MAACAIIPYLNSLPNDFVWDDRPLILHDYQIRSPRHAARLFRRDFFASSENQLKYGYYRPLITFSYMTDYFLWGRKPWGFRLTNILLHAGCALLAVRLFQKILPAHFWAPWLTGWLFALHPVHVESVAWIAGRTDVFATFFILLSLLLHIRGRERKSRFGMAGALAACCAALLCKETAIVLPALVFAYELILHGERPLSAFRRAGPLALAVVIYAVWRTLATQAGWNPSGISTPVEFAASVLKTTGRYLILLFFPLRLCAYIQNPPPDRLFDPVLWMGLTAAAISAGLLWRWRKSQPVRAWMIAAFAVSLLPVMNVIRISGPADMGFPMAERFLYLPSVFFCMGAACVFAGIPSALARTAVVGAVAILFATRVVTRNTVWRDEASFFGDCLRSAPDAPLLHAAYASHLLSAGRAEEAAAGLERAVQLNLAQTGLESPFLLNNLAAAYRTAGRYEKAWAALQRVSSNFEHAAIHYNRAAIQAALGHIQAAEQSYRAALRNDPLHFESWMGLGQLLDSQGRFADAAACYEKAAAMFPDELGPLMAWGIALKRGGRLADATAVFQKALAVAPTTSEAHCNLGIVLAMQGDMARAEEELRAAARLHSDYWDAWNALGTLYARQGRRADAEQCFDAVLTRNPNQPDALANKAVLRFQEGRLPEARRLVEKALEADPSHERARSYLRQFDAAISGRPDSR